VYTLSAEPGVGADAASGKPRLRLAANTTPPPLHKSSERQS
jgi:hypothetical protein